MKTISCIIIMMDWDAAKEATNMFLAFNGSKQKFNFWKMIVTSNCFFFYYLYTNHQVINAKSKRRLLIPFLGL